MEARQQRDKRPYKQGSTKAVIRKILNYHPYLADVVELKLSSAGILTDAILDFRGWTLGLIAIAVANLKSASKIGLQLRDSAGLTPDFPRYL